MKKMMGGFKDAMKGVGEKFKGAGPVCVVCARAHCVGNSLRAFLQNTDQDAAAASDPGFVGSAFLANGGGGIACSGDAFQRWLGLVNEVDFSANKLLYITALCQSYVFTSEQVS